MVQRDYGYNIPLGIPGGIYDLSDKHIVSRTLDSDVVAKLGMGLICGMSAGETVKLPETGTTADAFEGIFVHGSKQLEHRMDGAVESAGGDRVGLMQKGRIWAMVAPSVTVSYGAKVALIISGDHAGKFTDSGDTTVTSKITVTGAVFAGKADTDNGIAVIELK